MGRKGKEEDMRRNREGKEEDTGGLVGKGGMGDMEDIGEERGAGGWGMGEGEGEGGRWDGVGGLKGRGKQGERGGWRGYGAVRNLSALCQAAPNLLRTLYTSLLPPPLRRFSTASPVTLLTKPRRPNCISPR